MPSVTLNLIMNSKPRMVDVVLGLTLGLTFECDRPRHRPLQSNIIKQAFKVSNILCHLQAVEKTQKFEKEEA